MDPLVGAGITVAVAALPVMYGLYRIHLKNAINVQAFCAACRKLLEAGHPDRFEKLLAAASVPLVDLIRFAWAHRFAPEQAPAGFDGYRQADRSPTYLEKIGPVLRPEVERLRSHFARAWLWTLPAFAPIPVLFLLLGRPTATAPWIIAAVLALASLLSIPKVVAQRGQIHTALHELVPLFERYAQADRP